MDLQKAIEWVFELGGSIEFYTCSGLEAVGFRFYRHCNPNDLVEYTHVIDEDPSTAIVALYNELSQKTRVELLRLTPYTPTPELR